VGKKRERGGNPTTINWANQAHKRDYMLENTATTIKSDRQDLWKRKKKREEIRHP